MVKTEQTNVYLLAIVAIVAIVGIVVLILNSGIDMMSGDMTGQAYIKLNTQSASLTVKPTTQMSDGSVEVVDSYMPDCTGTCRDSKGNPVCCA